MRRTYFIDEHRVRAAVVWLGGAMFAAGCSVDPDIIAHQYVVAVEHGFARQAYGLLSQEDRDVRAFNDFRRERVVAVEERIARLLARRSRVEAELIQRGGRKARVAIRVTRVDVGPNSRRMIADDLKASGPGVASRLQKLDLPTRTSTRTLKLVREPAGWRVFLGLAGADAAKEGAEVVRLKRLGEQRMARGHIEWALDTYEAAAALAPKDRGIRHALAMLRSLIDSRRSRHDPESYLDQLVVDGIRVEGPQIQGEVRNTGPLPLDQIELRVLGLDPKGNAVVQMTRQLSDVALMPGGRLRFEVAFDTPPKTWKGAVEVRVIRVRFRASEP